MSNRLGISGQIQGQKLFKSYKDNIYIYMESRKMVLMNLFAGQEQRYKSRERT